MSDHYNRYHLKHFAATIADCMDFCLPEAYAPAIDWASSILKKRLGGPADRVVLYHADAVGMYIWQKYTDLFAAVQEHTTLALPYASTIEPVTPAAHASMYTGLRPKEHGIKTYVRPQLTCRTLYDELLDAGKKVAIVCQEDSTFVHIFAGRNMDYFEEPDAQHVQEKTLELIASDEYDLISVHTFAYDDAAHANGPESLEALEALALEANGFDRICKALKAFEGKHRILYSYSPDHGQHLIPGGTGDHNLLIPEDINVVHFLGTI